MLWHIFDGAKPRVRRHAANDANAHNQAGTNHVLAQYLPPGIPLQSDMAAAYGGQILQWKLSWLSATHPRILRRVLQLLQTRVPMAHLSKILLQNAAFKGNRNTCSL